MKILPQLELDGQLLIYKQNTKFWGVFLTTKLNWRPSIENVITKARTIQVFFLSKYSAQSLSGYKNVITFIRIFSQIKTDLRSRGILFTASKS